MGLAVGSTGLKVISSDGYYVELTLDQARMTNSQGLNTILAWQRGVVNAPHQEPPLEVIDGGEGPFRLVVPQHPDVGDYASGGDPNWQLSAKWVSAIEVQPLPAGVTPVDPATIPAGNIVVYGNLKTLSIDGIEPSWGPPGTVVTLSGYGFGAARGSSTVSFGGVNATGYDAWADSSIRCTVPPGVSGRVEVVVTTPQEVSEPFVFTVSDTPPPPPAAFYFAEGTCRPGFDPYICIQNPGAKDADVRITYMKGDGTTDTQELTVGKNSRSTVVVKEKLGEGDDAAHDFSARSSALTGRR